MDIKEFFERSQGKWFSQRTRYYLDRGKAENSKSDIVIENLALDNPALVAICQQNQIDNNSVFLGQKVNWDNSVDWGKTKDIGFATLIFICGDNWESGELLRSDSSKPEFISGRYFFGEDEALTLIIEKDSSSFEERIWFASPNLRLRTTVLKHNDGASQTAFYSEIRRVS